MTSETEIARYTIWHMEIPFRKPFKHAIKERTTSGSVLLKIVLADGTVGYGEALPREYVSGESVASVLDALEHRLIPDLRRVETSISSARDLEALTRGWLESPMTQNDLTAVGAVELALIDALSSRAGKNVYDWLGMPAQRGVVGYSMVLSCGDERKLVKHLLLSRLLMINDLKLKVTADLEETKSALKLIRRYHPGANVRVDANCDWNLDIASRQMELLGRFDVKSVEQPLPKAQIDDLSRLVAEFPSMLLCVDESLCSYNEAKELIRKNAATSFNIRITKNGGFFNSLRIYRLAKENGIQCQLGAQVGETSILSLYGRAFAAVTGDLLYHEGSFGTRLLKEEICHNPTHFGFRGRASTRLNGPGLGLSIDDALISKHAQQTIER